METHSTICRPIGAGEASRATAATSHMKNEVDALAHPGAPPPIDRREPTDGTTDLLFVEMTEYGILLLMLVTCQRHRLFSRKLLSRGEVIIQFSIERFCATSLPTLRDLWRA